MSGLTLPLPEPPDHELVDVLEQIRYARRELAEAHRVVELLALPELDRAPAAAWVTRRRIESTVAERRAELWAAELAVLEDRARALGGRP